MQITVKDEYLLDLERAKKIIKLSNSATSVCVTGPTGNGKSTWNSYMLRPESNKILGRNIGDVSQSSLLETRLFLTEKLAKNDVCIQFVRRDTMVNFQDVIVDVLGDICKSAYDDEVDSVEITESDIRNILNPRNKSYHAYQYVQETNIDLKPLIKNLTDIANAILQGEIPFAEAVDIAFKEKKKKHAKITKKEVIKDIVEERFYIETELLAELKDWFQALQNTILENLTAYWSEPSQYLAYGNLEQDDVISHLVKMAYDKESVFSLVFKQMIYAVRPSAGFLKAYRSMYQKDFADKPLHLNILDTVGLTHISDSKEEIALAIGSILKNPIDAVLFLCATDEKATVYYDCLQIFCESKRIAELPFTICRTKADAIIRNKRVNLYRRETGSNEIPDDAVIDYTKKALEEFLQEFISPNSFQSGEGQIGNNKNNQNQPVEFIALAPDLTKDINTVMEESLGAERSYRILLNLSLAADKAYAIGKLIKLQSKEPDTLPVTVRFRKQMLYDIADYMVAMNAKHSASQYLQYIGGNYHGRSITAFLRKHENGEGHETKAIYYENFKLHIYSMIRSWIAQYLRNNPSFFQDLVGLDYTNTLSIDGIEENFDGEHRLSEAFISAISRRSYYICEDLSKRTSYEFLSKDLWNCYDWCSWQEGFKKNLNLFNSKFSDSDYWRKSIKRVLVEETDKIIHKLCIVLND